MKTHIYILFIFLLIQQNLFSQSFDEKGIGIQYYGENLTRLGIKINYETPIFRKSINTSANSDNRFLKKQRIYILNSTVTTYRHKGLHYGLIVMPELIKRTIFPSGFKIENILGIGYHRSFLTDPTFISDGNGGFKKVPLAGQNSALIFTGFNLGYDMRMKEKSPYSFFIGGGLYFRYPHNSLVLPGITFNMGFCRHFSFKKQSNE